jgi:hypothetical protein
VDSNGQQGPYPDRHAAKERADVVKSILVTPGIKFISENIIFAEL